MTQPAVVELEGVHNFRALAPYRLAGGGRIRANMVFRSGTLDRMTAADHAHLGETIRVRSVLDLRHPDEFPEGQEPHALRELVQACSIFPETRRQAEIIDELNGLHGPGPTPARYMYYLEVGGERFRRGFELLARPNAYPVLVHCTLGKDRTGVLLALLMDLLGADDADIADEYGLSNASVGKMIDMIYASGREFEGTRADLEARLATPSERMAGFMELFRGVHGTAEKYLLAQGLSPAAIGSIRSTLVDHD